MVFESSTRKLLLFGVFTLQCLMIVSETELFCEVCVYDSKSLTEANCGTGANIKPCNNKKDLTNQKSQFGKHFLSIISAVRPRQGNEGSVNGPDDKYACYTIVTETSVGWNFVYRGCNKEGGTPSPDCSEIEPEPSTTSALSTLSCYCIGTPEENRGRACNSGSNPTPNRDNEDKLNKGLITAAEQAQKLQNERGATRATKSAGRRLNVSLSLMFIGALVA